MAKSKEALNEAAMQIILHAGDCRELLTEAIDMIVDDASPESVDMKVVEAKREISKAHALQTEMIQDSIEDDELHTTLLFTHAQDTLMTINSELEMVKSMIKLYRKISER